jgi:hypothetical protein
MTQEILVKRLDGKFEERLDDRWFAEYFEDPLTGLFRAEVFFNNKSKWVSVDHISLDDAQEAVKTYYDDMA